MNLLNLFFIAAVPLCLPILYAKHTNTTYKSESKIILGKKSPTFFPTRKPTPYPTTFPTQFPSRDPTTGFPSKDPTIHPTTSNPSVNPSVSPTNIPSIWKECIHKSAKWHNWWCQTNCAERIKEYPDRCMWNPSMTPTTSPSFSPSPKPCPPGHRLDPRTHEKCIPCEYGTYNHGGMHFEKTNCYIIPKNGEFTYLNSIDVKCKKWWMGNPIYEDGEYERGCGDAPDPSPSRPLTPPPTIAPTKFPIIQYPTTNPTTNPTTHPSTNPTNIPQTNNASLEKLSKHNNTLLYIIYAFLVLLIILLLSVVCCKYIKKKKRNKQKKLQDTILRTLELSNISTNNTIFSQNNSALANDL